VTVTDLDTAGFLSMRGIAFQRGLQTGPSAFEITFYDPDGRAEELAASFINTCCCRFADAVRRLKKVIEKPRADARGRRF